MVARSMADTEVIGEAKSEAPTFRGVFCEIRERASESTRPIWPSFLPNVYSDDECADVIIALCIRDAAAPTATSLFNGPKT